MGKTTRFCFTVACLISSAWAQDIVRRGEPPRESVRQAVTAAANRYIVTFTPGTPQSARANAAFLAGATVRHNYAGIDAIAITVPNTNVLDAVKRNPQVTRVLPDFIIRSEQKGGKGGGGGGSGGGGSAFLDFDTRQIISTEVQRVGMPRSGSDGTGIGVALIDSGIDFNHPDLAPAPNNLSTSFNALNPGGSCQDDGGHGTHIAGLIAALNNSIGIVGVAPAAKLYCVKVLASDLTGTDSEVMAGLDWVIQNHALVNPPIRSEFQLGAAARFW